MKKPKILFYDIETTPLQAWVWRCGKQVVNPSQLVEGADAYDIICIGYEWLHSKESGVLDWGYKQQNSKKMIQKFTDICDEADLIIGKNNKRFDDKHVNTLRLLHGLDGRPDLLKKVDDLETQIRKHFNFASNGLDYVSQQLGLGGKDNMKFQDWIDIVDQTSNGKQALNKMKKYCGKDVHDTKLIWQFCEKHMEPKYNYSAIHGDLRCKVCGSLDLRKNGYYTNVNGIKYLQYFCKEHNGYAGKMPVNGRKTILKG